MSMNYLSAAGLTDTDATVYEILLKTPDAKPSDLMKLANESRTNMYKILDRLVVLGLATKFDKNKKLHYKAANPARLLQLAREQREESEKAERELVVVTESLTHEYIKTHEQPGIRYYQGTDEIATIFDTIAHAKSEVLFVHTDKGIDFYGFETMHKLRMKAVKAGVNRRALTPDVPRATIDYKTTDPLVLLKRTWLAAGEYTSPVEWGVYDDKIYIISYGKEALGLTIESKQIADAFKELFVIIESNQKLRSDYNNLPLVANKPGRND